MTEQQLAAFKAKLATTLRKCYTSPTACQQIAAKMHVENADKRLTKAGCTREQVWAVINDARDLAKA